jgi:LCP family protein required for cell wall assembly
VNDLDLLREWPAESAAPEARERAFAELEALWLAPTHPVPMRSARRRLGARVLVALAVTAALVAGGVIWAQRETDQKFATVGRIHLPRGALSGASGGGAVPTTYLIVGSDSRAGLTDPAFGSPDALPGQFADTIIVLRVNRQGAQALWVPRDLFVDSTSSAKMDAELRDPSVLIAALRDRLGVLVNHYVQVRFRGFERIIDALGGVSLTVPYPARDAYSGLDVLTAGCVTFNGTRALEWARSRHLEELVNGQWTTVDPVPDIGRISRQQQLVSAIAAKARRTLAHHPRSLLRVVDAMVPNLQVDAGLDRAGIVTLAKTLLGLTPGTLATATIPWKTTPPRNGVAGLELNDPSVQGDVLFAQAATIGSLQSMLDRPVTQRSVDCATGR